MQQIVEDAWLLPLGYANAVLLRHDGELTLIDTGFPGKEQLVFDAIQQLGHQESDLKHILLTHAHPDHLGSAGAIVKRVGASTWIHEKDAEIARHGGPFRVMSPAKGLLQRILFTIVWKPECAVMPVRVSNLVRDGDIVPAAGGLQVLHIPGHCAGQIALLWKDGKLLIAGDVGSNMFGLSDPLGFEDEAEGHRSQEKLTKLSFEAAAFGHGSVIKKAASERVRRAWSQKR